MCTHATDIGVWPKPRLLQEAVSLMGTEEEPMLAKLPKSSIKDGDTLLSVLRRSGMPQYQPTHANDGVPVPNLPKLVVPAVAFDRCGP